jgi:hypothetical protein
MHFRAFVFAVGLSVIASGSALADDPAKTDLPAAPAAKTDLPAAPAAKTDLPAAPAAKTDLPAAPANPSIQIARGDSWTYEIRDDVTGDVRGTISFEVTKVSETEIETRVSQQKQFSKSPLIATAIFDARWRMKDNGKFAYHPYLDSTGIPTDLQVGKTWTFNYQALRKGSALTREFAGVGKVEAWERIALPGGASYDAFKIDVTFATKSARKQETHSIMWFAPAVNRLVKRVDESRDNGKLRDATEQTLVTYKPAAKS